MKKILVIKLGALGDFVVAAGRIMKLKERYPDAEFTLMTHKSLVSIGRQMGMFSKFIIDNRVSYWNIPEQYRLLREVIDGQFDLVLNFQPIPRVENRYYPIMRWFMPKSFSWARIRYNTVTHVEKTKARTWGKAREEEYIFEPALTDLTFLHGENKHFHELPERFVTMIPGCSPGHPHKRWPSYRFAELAKRLAEHGIHSVVIGTKAEASEIEAIVSSCPMAVNMLNKTSLMDIPDLAQRALATVGNDTGPSHMTALSGTPMIALYATRTKPCSIKGKQAINMVSPGTIDQITVDDVWEKLEPFLKLK